MKNLLALFIWGLFPFVVYVGCNSAGEGFQADPAAQMLAAAKKDLSKKLLIAEKEIESEQPEAATWPDTALGCPEPGKMYAQVLTPGFKLVLRARGKFYEYHTGNKVIKLCKEGPVP